MDVGRTHEILPAWWPSGWFPSAIHSCLATQSRHQKKRCASKSTHMHTPVSCRLRHGLAGALARSCTGRAEMRHASMHRRHGASFTGTSRGPHKPKGCRGAAPVAPRPPRCGRRRRCRRCGVAHPALVDNTTVRFWVVARLSAGVHRNAARANRAHSLSVSSRCGCCLTYSGA